MMEVKVDGDGQAGECESKSLRSFITGLAYVRHYIRH